MGCTSSKAAAETTNKKDISNYPRFAVGQTERLVSRANRIQQQQQPTTLGQETKQNTQGILLDDQGKLHAKEIQRRTSSSQTTHSIEWKNKNHSDHTNTNTTTAVVSSTIEYAHWTQRGYYPDNIHKANQDALGIVTQFAHNHLFMAVYDGHGSDGHTCAVYAQKKLPPCISKHVIAMSVAKYKEQLEYEKKINNNTKTTQIKTTQPKLFQPDLWPALTDAQYHECCRKGFLECNRNMHSDDTVPDKLSGTTAITVLFHNKDNAITISNVGDSRVIVGHLQERKNDNNNNDSPTRALVAVPLSRDQTPYRKDERERVKALGASVMSIDQMQGKEEMHEDWGDLVLGEDVDIHGDPPRIWVQGKDYPGTAFTRSIGDTLAEKIGVTAEPEVITTRLTSDDKYLVIATDGIFEFLTNQDVIDICEKSETPLEAAEALTKASYDQWLIYENRTDDITVIVCFLDIKVPPPTDGTKGTTKEILATASMYGEKPVRKVPRGKNDTLSQVDISIEDEQKIP